MNDIANDRVGPLAKTAALGRIDPRELDVCIGQVAEETPEWLFERASGLRVSEVRTC